MVTNKREYMREYMRQYRADNRGTPRRLTRANPSVARTFVGVDGEGGNLDNGYHAYFLLRIGDSYITPSEGNVRLTSAECLEFIACQSPDYIYVSYFFDYDATKILEDLGWGKLKRLMNRGSRTGTDGRQFPISYRDYEIDYLPRKFIKVRKRTEDIHGNAVFSPWITINDVGTFFQASFVDTLNNWRIGTPEQIALVVKGKAQRAVFDASELPFIAEYNGMEVELLAELMDAFRNACIDTGYLPTKWQGPGLLAESMFAAHGVAKTKDVGLLNDSDNAGLNDYARNAFYGGRFETSIVGPSGRKVYQWDINSAYPYAMQFLPCLQHGKWEFIEGGDKLAGLASVPKGEMGERYYLAYATFQYDNQDAHRPMFFGMPIRRDDGSIHFPANGAGWYWSFELDAAIHQRVTVHSAYLYTRLCNCRPLAFVKDVYRERLALGKNGPGMILKLGLNSLYGKTAQSIGSPRYANPIWASFITAYTRMMIQDFIHSSPVCAKGWCGKDVVMIATDSVATFTDRTDMEGNKLLGGWDVEIHHTGMFVVQPGLYFGSSGKPAKTRGIPRSSATDRESEFRGAFSNILSTSNVSAGNVIIPQKLFCGIRYALHRHNLKLLGQWIEFRDKESQETGKVVSFDWTNKRVHYPALPPVPGLQTFIQTFPYDGHPRIVTTPYSRDIGGLQRRDEYRLAFEAQPDYIDGMEDDQ